MSITQRNTVINIRAADEQRDLIDRAAALLRKTRSEFMLSSAIEEAENVLLDRRVFALSDATWQDFIARLDEPPVENERLRKLMATPAPWDA